MKRHEQFELCRRLVVAVVVCGCLSAATALAQSKASPPEPAVSEPPVTVNAPAPKADLSAPPAKEPASVAVTRPGTFEIHVRGDDLRGVLQLLSVQGNRNIICTKDIQGTVTVDLYGVTFEQALDAVMASSGFTYAEENGSIYVYTTAQKAALLKAKIKPAVRAFKLSYIPAADALVLVAPALSESGKVVVSKASAVGIAPNKTDAGGDSFPNCDMLVVSDVPEALDRVVKLLEEIDVKPDQVLVETTILSAKLTENNKLGVNFNALGGGTDLGNSNATWSTSGAPTLTSDKAVGSGINFRTDFTPISGGMTLGIFGNDMAFFITALETVTDVTVIANPKLMIVNKQRGEVLVGKRDGYKTSTMTGTNTIESVEYLETGTKLLVRPFVGRDKYIRMEIHPEDSDGGVVGGLPSQKTTEVTSNILVKDGHTIVIGGLFRENTTTDKSQVPVLGNIPYIGTLFRTTSDTTERDEVIILITPHIIASEADEAASRQMRDDAERIQVGARNGLQWWSSERLSMGCVRSAKQALREGKREQAIWDLDMALSIRPRLMEAISLKEQLTRKAYWADEVQSAPIRYVVERMIMQELGKCYKTVIPPDRPLDNRQIPEDVRKALDIQPEINQPVPQPLMGLIEKSNVKVQVEVPSGAKSPAEAPQPTPDQEKPAGAKLSEPQSAAPTQEPAAQPTTQPAENQVARSEPDELAPDELAPDELAPDELAPDDTEATQEDADVKPETAPDD
jgi:type IV pilus assembly protein PilQ